MATCPFCMTEISDQASVCKSCGATKGYTTANGSIYGESQTIIFGVILPLALGIAPFIFFGFNIITLIWLGIMLIPVLFSLFRLKTGGRWYR